MALDLIIRNARLSTTATACGKDGVTKMGSKDGVRSFIIISHIPDVSSRNRIGAIGIAHYTCYCANLIFNHAVIIPTISSSFTSALRPMCPPLG